MKNLLSIAIYQFNFYFDSLFASIAGTLMFMVSRYDSWLNANQQASPFEKKQFALERKRNCRRSSEIDYSQIIKK